MHLSRLLAQTVTLALIVLLYYQLFSFPRTSILLVLITFLPHYKFIKLQALSIYFSRLVKMKKMKTSLKVHSKRGRNPVNIAENICTGCIQLTRHKGLFRVAQDLNTTCGLRF